MQIEQVSWPYVINALLTSFQSDDILMKSHDEVTRAVQKDVEDESHIS